MKYSHYSSPIGPLLIAVHEQRLHAIGFEHDTRPLRVEPHWEQNAAATAFVSVQLAEYFAGTRTTFDLALTLSSTPFAGRVLAELQQVPYGTTLSYAELAQRSGNAKASRAAGTACGRNPIPIVIPCHRIVGSSGKLTGFAGGLVAKQYLLQLERNNHASRTK